MSLRVTIDDVMSWKPCGHDGSDDGPYDRAYVKSLFGRRKYLTALQILDLDIPAEDRLWAVLREELIDPRALRLFACREAELALNRVQRRGGAVDPRSREAIRVARRYANGMASDEELDAARAAADAARAAADAARAAARDAARAAEAAARDAAWAAADAALAAAWVAAWDATRRAQVKRLRKMLEEGS